MDVTVDRSQHIVRLLGVPFGAKRERLQPLVAALADHGVTLHSDTPSRLRVGDTSGAKVLVRLRCSALLRTDNAGLKDRCYMTVAQAGLRLRAGIEPTHHTPRSRSDGYTAALATELGYDAQALRRCLRAMRTDLLAATDTDAANIVETAFGAVAEAYLGASLQAPPSLRSCW